ncbi:macrophage mannose receptor 1-like [Pelobates cultripes]|uniref:Macrophage mannose receptor 1-like n=2 Tax=Pelobates cultripes TaxID=61616 RepID=A0AAD1VVX5_PELCU|nr:macrophage mannose receptor 1-like [Pelobates cultripes]
MVTHFFFLEESNVYLQEESIYEPVGEREKSQDTRWKLPNIKSCGSESGHSWRQYSTETGRLPRLKIFFSVVFFFLVLLILSLCGLGAGLAKYYAMTAEIETLKKDQKIVDSLGSFLLYNEDRKKCADIRFSSLSSHQLEMTASICSSDSPSQLFRWFPGGKLLNIKARQCVGVKGTPRTLIPLIILPCDSQNVLSWVCTNETLLGIKQHSLYFNYGNNPQGAVILYGGSGSWSRWKSRDIDGKLQAGGVCAQTCRH